MRIGITCDLKTDTPPANGLPDDFQEEFDSPVTVEGIAAVLRGLGHAVEVLGDGRPMLQRLLADPPDFVFNFAEGHGVGRSREARVPAVLEMLDIPYTGSDPLTLAVTLDKDCARRVVKSHGISVPAGVVCTPDDDVIAVLGRAGLPATPWIVKPAWEGSSKGIRGKCVVDSVDEAAAAVRQLHVDYGQPVLVEQYVRGEELTVGVVGNDPPQIVGVMRVIPRKPGERFVYSLEVKRDWRRQVAYECPAALPPEVFARVEAATLAVYRALGCRDVARVDFRLQDGTPYFLEVNPLPGLNPESSDLVILSGLAGWSYERLVGAVFEAAAARFAATPVATPPA
jgi:D-alanine-D-alanine ligase